jgi:hypothetical protein
MSLSQSSSAQHGELELHDSSISWQLVASQRPLRQSRPAQQSSTDVQESSTSPHVTPHTPALQWREQQSSLPSQTVPAPRHPATQVSATQRLPAQHARSARQCSPMGAHAHVPLHANEQQSACCAQVAPV